MSREVIVAITEIIPPTRLKVKWCKSLFSHVIFHIVKAFVNQFKTGNVKRFFDNFCFVFQEELDVLRAKFEKMDKERQELRTQNEKLESRVCT